MVHVAYTARKKGNTYMHRKQSRYIYVACKVHNNVARSLTDAIAWRARDREFMRILRVRLGARVDAVFYTEYTWLRGFRVSLYVRLCDGAMLLYMQFMNTL